MSVKDPFEILADEITLIRRQIDQLQRTSLDKDDAQHLNAVVAEDLPDREDGLGQLVVAQRCPGLDHPQHQVRGTETHQLGGLGHVRIADDHVESAVLGGVRMGFVPGVDDGPGPGGG